MSCRVRKSVGGYSARSISNNIQDGHVRFRKRPAGWLVDRSGQTNAWRRTRCKLVVPMRTWTDHQNPFWLARLDDFLHFFFLAYVCAFTQAEVVRKSITFVLLSQGMGPNRDFLSFLPISACMLITSIGCKKGIFVCDMQLRHNEIPLNPFVSIRKGASGNRGSDMGKRGRIRSDAHVRVLNSHYTPAPLPSVKTATM